MNFVRVAASRPKKWEIGSELIMWYQKTDYSHVLIIKDDQVYQSTHIGCHIVPLQEFLIGHNIVWSMEIESERLDWDFINTSVKNNVPYGFFQIGAIAIKKIFRVIFREGQEKNLICSEFVGKALRFKWVDDFTNPEDIVSYLINGDKNDVSNAR